LNNEIESNLDAKLETLLTGALGQRDTADSITSSFGIGKPYLVYFVTGMIYSNLQIYFVDLYKSKGMAEEQVLRDDWEIYWKKNVKSIIEKLENIYSL